jgi:hypothetical protein
MLKLILIIVRFLISILFYLLRDILKLVNIKSKSALVDEIDLLCLIVMGVKKFLFTDVDWL